MPLTPSSWQITSVPVSANTMVYVVPDTREGSAEQLSEQPNGLAHQVGQRKGLLLVFALPSPRCRDVERSRKHHPREAEHAAGSA